MESKIPASLRVIGRSFVDWWDGWLDMVLVMIVWFVAQITIILGPPATFGLYYVAYSMINGEALGIRGLISGGRKYFWKAWLWGAVNLLVIIILTVNVNFYSNIAASWAPFLLIIVALLGFLWFCMQFYALPYFMEQDIKNLFIAMRNGLLTTLAAPFFTFVLMIIVVIVIGLSAAFVIPLFLGLPGVIPLLGVRALYNRLESFGLREREKTPREIEYEESGNIPVPGSSSLGADGSSSAAKVAKGKRNVQKGK